MVINLFLAHRRQVPSYLKGMKTTHIFFVKSSQKVNLGSPSKNTNIMSRNHQFFQFLDLFLSLCTMIDLNWRQSLEIFIEFFATASRLEVDSPFISSEVSFFFFKFGFSTEFITFQVDFESEIHESNLSL